MNLLPLRRKSPHSTRQPKPLSLPTLRLAAANEERTQQILWTPPTNPRLTVTTSQAKTPKSRREWAFLAGGMASLALCFVVFQHWPVSRPARPPKPFRPIADPIVARMAAPTAPASFVTAPAFPARPIRPSSFAAPVGPFIVPPGVPLGEP